jgi:hypothetical protein
MTDDLIERLEELNYRMGLVFSKSDKMTIRAAIARIRCQNASFSKMLGDEDVVIEIDDNRPHERIVKYKGDSYHATSAELSLNCFSPLINLGKSTQRSCISCLEFLVMKPEIAKTLFYLTDEGYENTLLRAKAINAAAAVYQESKEIKK